MNDTDRSTETGTGQEAEPAIFGIAGLLAALAVPFHIAFIVGHVHWAGWPAVILFLTAGVLGISGGWWVGAKPPPETRAEGRQRVDRGLVGSRILTGSGAVTVVDDSTSGGEHLRRSVVAVDADGHTGILFVELDRRGNVVAAAHPPGSDWTPASVI